MALAKKNSKSSSAKPKGSGFVMCVDNSGYEASLEVGKVYRALPGKAGMPRGYQRVVDESGEDYLFATKRFVTIELPPRGRKALMATV